MQVYLLVDYIITTSSSNPWMRKGEARGVAKGDDLKGERMIRKSDDYIYLEKHWLTLGGQ